MCMLVHYIPKIIFFLKKALSGAPPPPNLPGYCWRASCPGHFQGGLQHSLAGRGQHFLDGRGQHYRGASFLLIVCYNVTQPSDIKILNCWYYIYHWKSYFFSWDFLTIGAPYILAGLYFWTGLAGVAFLAEEKIQKKYSLHIKCKNLKTDKIICSSFLWNL